jgi:hypothetical protein
MSSARWSVVMIGIAIYLWWNPKIARAGED